MNDGGEGHARLAALARERDLREDEAGRRKAGPLRRRAAVVGEREAADEYGPAAGGRSGSSAGSSANAARPSSRACAATSANRPGPRASSLAACAERGEHEAVAIGLLEAGVAVVGPPRRENRGAQVELGREPAR